MDEVAKRAGVSKATIYRWWPTKETLALDALQHEWGTAPADRSVTRGRCGATCSSVLRPWIRLASACARTGG